MIPAASGWHLAVMTELYASGASIYRAMNKPMILGDTPANHELFSADQNTIFVPAGDARFLTNAILHFFGDSSA